MALGAQRWHLTRLILGRTAAQAGVGFGAGLACTAVWARLFWTDTERGLMSAEPLAMVAGGVVLLTLAASLLPVPQGDAHRIR